MQCSGPEIFELLLHWKAENAPLQCHYFRDVDSIHLSLGFITSVSSEAFEFSPISTTDAEPVKFHYAGGTGEYSERVKEMVPLADSTMRTGDGGVLTLHALDGTLMFIELDRV